MIQEFTVQNFLSIKDKQTISFEASKDKTAKELMTVKVSKNTNLLKMIILYGANASGKSNIIFAIEKIWKLLFLPSITKDESIYIEPFALTRNEDTIMSIIFYVNKIKYDYTIQYNKNNIILEELKYAPKGVLSLFYRRDYKGNYSVPKIKFGSKLKLSNTAKNSIRENTFNNHTVLSTFGKISVNAEEFAKLHSWIKQQVHEVDHNRSIIDIAQTVIDDNSKKQFFLDAIAKADFNISNIDLVERDNKYYPDFIIDSIKENKNLSEDDKSSLLSKLMKDVKFLHHTDLGDFNLSQQLESSGTLEYFKLLNTLYMLVKENHIHMIDELDNHLHYDLLIYFLTTYILNSNSSQLIFTTHNLLLLDEDFIRRDMVWFTEKSSEIGSTEIFSATDFGLHKNISLFKAYKTGKLGAKPEIGSSFLSLTK